jgi:AraC family transcriptional regulator
VIAVKNQMPGFLEGTNPLGEINEAESRLEKLKASFLNISDKEELFFKIIEFFPYPIQVYSPEGTSIMVNSALLDEFEISSRDMVIGRYNILKDPEVIKAGILEQLQRAFNGEVVHLKNVKVPLESFEELYKTDCYHINALYQDGTVFPILDENKNVLYVVVLMFTRKYKGKESIIDAQEYLKKNWIKDFDIDDVSRAANLSPSYLSRLFKKEVGVTLYNYYLNIKIEKIKEKLLDPNLSVSQAFAACGLDYNGSFAKLFKKNVGLTPSEYRKSFER